MDKVLNKIPEGWTIAKVNDTCDVFDSMRIPLNSQERALRKGPYPYYGANGVQGYIDDFIFDGEYVLLAEDGGYFDEWSSRPISYLVSGKFWVNNHAHILKAKKGHETRFVHYSLVHKNILKHINGGTRSKLNQSDMRDIEYLTPPLPEQQKIATILSSVDDAIEKTRAQIDKLKDLKTGMMQELLTKGIGHTEFKDSPVGRIPASWSYSRVGEYIKESKLKTKYDGEYEVFTSSRNGLVKQSEYYGVNRLTRRSSVGFNVLPENYITYRSRSDDDRFVFNINKLGKSGAVSKYYPVFTCAKEKAHNDFFHYLLNFYSKKLAVESVGTSQVVLSYNALSSASLPIPSIDEQGKIKDILLAQDALILQHAKKLEQSESLKKALMQDLLTGKVRVKLDNNESTAAPTEAAEAIEEQQYDHAE